MIYDHIKNIGLYKGLSPALDIALEFIETVTPDIEVGSYPLAHGVKAVVSEGSTSLVNPKGYEAHRKYAAVRAAIVYSLVDTCKSRGVDPREWMEDVLLRIPGNENNREALRELLPDKWAKKSN